MRTLSASELVQVYGILAQTFIGNSSRKLSLPLIFIHFYIELRSKKFALNLKVNIQICAHNLLKDKSTIL